jgi:hypothetical protein
MKSAFQVQINQENAQKDASNIFLNSIFPILGKEQDENEALKEFLGDKVVLHQYQTVCHRCHQY